MTTPHITSGQIKKRNVPLYSVITDWIAGIVGILAIGGTTARGAKVLSDRRKAAKQRKEDEDKKRSEREAFVDKLPATLDSLSMAVVGMDKMAATLNTLLGAVEGLADGQREFMELRRIQASQDKTAYYRCRPDGRAYEVSQPLCELFGLTADEMLANDGAGWVSAIEHPTEAWQHWVASINSNLPYEDSYTIINRSVSPPRRTRVTTRAWAVRGVNGNIRNFYGVVLKEEGDK